MLLLVMKQFLLSFFLRSTLLHSIGFLACFLPFKGDDITIMAAEFDADGKFFHIEDPFKLTAKHPVYHQYFRLSQNVL